tara:strand:- start:744 stop:1379 length:636 start_codon:yes stop_codon:yes gene_type:complete
MADINETFDDITGEQSFFIPGKKKEKRDFKPFAKGDYFGHIVECESKIVEVKGGKNKARLYTYTFEASKENKDTTFMFQNINGEMEETKGDCYVGSKFRGKVWRFLEPTEKDTFESYPEGNAGYLRFCESIGVECPVERRVIDGNDIEVQLLPNLSEGDMLGKPGIAFVDRGRPWINDKGEKKQYWDAKWINKWAEGKERTISGASDEIPF